MPSYSLGEIVTVAQRQFHKGGREEAITPKVDGNNLVGAIFEEIVFVDVCGTEEQAMSLDFGLEINTFISLRVRQYL